MKGKLAAAAIAHRFDTNRRCLTATFAAVTAVVTLVFAVPPISAQNEMQSDWLEFVKGHRDSKTGAEVMGVKKDPETGQATAMLRVPKKSVVYASDMEEVRVVGQAPEKREMPDVLPELQTEWVDDYDNDHYGLLIKFTEDQAVPFRLFFSAQGQGGSIDGGVRP
ncbi:MAG: hypothetical protein V2I24_15330 [Halieaceae bacterium]|jgi:hypothetical protein|nr:hypothetical protein [Halieaceae bacterium]